MDKLKGTIHRIFGLQSANELPTASDYRHIDGDEPKDSERLLTSPSPSDESDRTACEKLRNTTCDCVCHHGSPPHRLTPARIHLCAGFLWLLGAVLIFLVFWHGDSNTPANGTFGWCESTLILVLNFAQIELFI